MCAGYGAVEVVKDLDLVVHTGEVVALLGVNGAGKTTIVRALSGQLKPSGGEVWLKGRPTTAPLHKRVREGMRLITEDRSVFMGLTTAENLRVGGQSREACLEVFPELERLLHRRAGLLSGGEQQMLALARALAAATLGTARRRAVSGSRTADLRSPARRTALRCRSGCRGAARRAAGPGCAQGRRSGIRDQ